MISKMLFSVCSLLMLSNSVYAASISFVGPCEEAPLFATEIAVERKASVGQLTIKVLDLNEIDYIGSEIGMNSIFNTPTDTEAIEIISREELYAYGWCYSVNGAEPQVYPNEVFVEPQGQEEIIWWYGYAHYKKGKWLSQCLPANKRKPDFLCDSN